MDEEQIASISKQAEALDVPVRITSHISFLQYISVKERPHPQAVVCALCV